MRKYNKPISSQRMYNILLKPLTTEKSTNLQQYNQYSFLVSKNSNSSEIKQCIESLFKVKVIKINTSILRGKLKSFKGDTGYRKDAKKDWCKPESLF